MKILIVEDDFISRKVLEKQMQLVGDVDVTVNGREAVDAFRMQLEQNDSYQVVCLDIMMPEMDGQEALRRIRKLESDAGIQGSKRAKIIMTTAVDQSEAIMEAFRDECDGYLIKPIQKKDIRKVFDLVGMELPE